MSVSLMLLALLPTMAWTAEVTREPILQVEVDHPILCLAADGTTPTATGLRVAPRQFPEGAAYTYTWEQIQDELLPGAVRVADKPIRFDATDRALVQAAFPASGVYAVRVTVTDAVHHVSAARNTWINVWDPRPALTVAGVPDPLTAVPGMAPPAVRNVPPEPGPFVHPRLFCAPEDWADIHARAVEGKSKIAAAGWKALGDSAKRGVDPNSNHGKFLAQVEAYAAAGFTGAMPDLMMGWNDKNGIERAIGGLLDQLAQASFAQWLKHDPSTPATALPPEDLVLRQRVATQVAGVCRVLLDNSWDRTTGQFHPEALGYIKNLERPGERVADCFSQLALAYDFAAPWMTLEQLQDTRNFLVAVGRARSGPGFDNGRPSVRNHIARRGNDQNGTFGVWGEPMVLLSLVVAGEESAADPRVVTTFLTPPKPADYATSHAVPGYDLLQLAEADGGAPHASSRAFPPAITWPHARKADVAWLQKQVFTFQDVMLSPWGFTLERLAYFGYMSNEAWPAAYVFARYGGFNQYVGGYFYQTVNNWLFTMYPSGGVNTTTSFSNTIGIYEHHSGGGDYRQQWVLFLKHLYPQDPVVDYVYAAQAPDLERRVLNRITTCIFGVDPGLPRVEGALEGVATAARLPLTKLDPYIGVAVMRSGWKDDDLQLFTNAGPLVWGHMNAEHGSFGLFALGRHWSVPSGYHKVMGNFQSLVQIQNPAWAACPVTDGFMTQNPCIPPTVPGSDYEGGFPTPSARLLEVREAPDQAWSLAAIDQTVAYNFTCAKPTTRPPVTFDTTDWTYPGLREFRAAIDPYYAPPSPKATFTPVPPSCTIQRALRTLVTVRGARPYVLVVDDVRKDDQPATYRWIMNDKITMKDEGRATSKDDASFCVVMAPGATAQEATLLHRRDQGDQPGLPRLLVRDLGPDDTTRQPVIRLEQRVFRLSEEKYNQEIANALVIERRQVVEPRYRVLLFPYRTGEALPTTTWNADRTRVTIDLGNGQRDEIAFDTNQADHRTRVAVRRLP